MELWERSEALALLQRTLRETADAGRLVLVPGEAGIGKSSLVRAFAAGCGPEARVLWGFCDPLVTPRASGPLQDMRPPWTCSCSWAGGSSSCPRCSS